MARHVVAALVAAAVCLPGALGAQTSGRLTGVIRDTSGAVLPGVAVTITSSSSLITRTAITDAAGKYEIDDLPAGGYLVSAALEGFDPSTTRVDVAVDHVALDLVLTLSTFVQHVQVTAARTGATDVQTTPLAITAVSGRTIEQLGIETVDDLVGVAPGVTTIPSGGGNPLVSIRGIGTNSFVAGADPSSTMYLDGVYLGRPAMAAIEFLNVDRIEVLRGPQGTLYGRNSVGGAINIVTRQPTNALEASARLTAGDYGKFRAEAAVGGPLVKNKVMGNAAFVRGSDDGFVRDLNHPDHPLGGENTWAGRGQLRLILGTRTELLMSGDYGRFDGTPLAYAKAILAKPGFTFNNPDSLWAVRTSHLAIGHNVQQGASTKLTVQLNAATVLSSLTAYRTSSYRYFIDADSTELPILTGNVPDDQRQASEELTVVRRSPRTTWIGGAFLYDDHNEGAVEVTTYPLGIQTRLFPKIDANARALFGQASYGLTRRVTLTGGTRYTHEQKDLDNTGGVYRLGTATLADPATFYDYVDHTGSNAWTPKGAIEVRLSADTFAYASATRGFKSGGFNTTAHVSGRHFGPEFAWSYEGGLKHAMADGRVRANVAVFDNDYRDLQVLSFLAPGVFEISNAGAATIKGVEIETAVVPRRSVQLLANVSWLDARYDRYRARVTGLGELIDAAGKRLNNAPEWSGRASAIHQFAAPGSGTVSTRADVSWQSRVFFTAANDAFETQGPYGLLHLRTSFEPPSHRWEIAVYMRNAANTAYVTGTGNAAPAALIARPGEPRRWGTQFTIRH